jgi:hypothetical protein
MPTVTSAENPWLCIYIYLMTKYLDPPAKLALRHALISSKDARTCAYSHHVHEAARLVSQGIKCAENNESGATCAASRFVAITL